MNRIVFALLLASVLTSAHAVARAPEDAIKAVNAYSQALMAADCPAVVRMSGVLSRHPEATESLCSTYAGWKQRGLVERLRAPTAFLSSGQDRLVVVPNSRIAMTGGRPMINNGVYIVYSNDAGRSWKIIDIGCDHLADWVKGVYPAYDGRPTFSATVDRPIASR